MENPIKKINWETLRTQKSLLLETINNKYVSPIHKEALEGILGLIDNLQDYAVDEFNISEMYVFGFKEEDNRNVESTMSEEKLIIVCANCKSDNVELKHWVNANTDEIGECCDDDEDTWCNDCETHSGVYAVKLKPESKVIGFQVVGEDGTSFEGDIHPDMDGSFCIYNLSQAREMLNDNKYIWKLLSIWEGDIENPRFMFTGDPRD